MMKTGKLLFPCVLLSLSCMFHQLKEDVGILDNYREIYGEVAMPDSIEGLLIAVAFSSEDDSQRIASFKVVDPDVKLFAIILNPGNYRFALFHDKNGNRIIDENEPVYLHENGNRLSFSDIVKRINLLDLTVPVSGSLPSSYPRDLNGQAQSADPPFNLAFGEQLVMENRCFSEETGRMGLWEPSRYLAECGAGIYWNEEYDTSRIPVLFISGAGGSVQEWRYFLRRLDHRKFQAWYFLFPSGMRITIQGINLSNWIDIMHDKCGFQRIYLIAHSMGGLIGRYALIHSIDKYRNDSAAAPLLIKKFITISTPWNGHRMAKKGVENVSVPIPSWHDVIPGSPFLQTIFTSPIKPYIDHHLLFGYTSKSGDDGVVDLSSVLLEEAQRDAVEIHAFEAEHVDILHKDVVFEYVQKILYDSENSITAPEENAPCTTDSPN